MTYAEVGERCGISAEVAWQIADRRKWLGGSRIDAASHPPHSRLAPPPEPTHGLRQPDIARCPCRQGIVDQHQQPLQTLIGRVSALQQPAVMPQRFRRDAIRNSACSYKRLVLFARLLPVPPDTIHSGPHLFQACRPQFDPWHLFVIISLPQRLAQPIASARRRW
jgi:hypothetical protein